MLSTLVLTQNAVAELADLEALKGMGRLVHLSLVGNPVQNKEVCAYLNRIKGRLLMDGRTTDITSSTSRRACDSSTSRK